MNTEITETELTDKYGESRHYDFSLKELFDALKQEFTADKYKPICYGLTVEYVDGTFFDQSSVIVIKGKYGRFTLSKYLGSAYMPERSLLITLEGIVENSNKGWLKYYRLKDKDIEQSIYKNYLSESIKFITEHLHIINNETYFANLMQ